MWDTDIQTTILRTCIVIICWALANHKNRSGWKWAACAAVIPPLALIALIMAEPVMPEDSKSYEVEQLAYETSLAAGNEPSVARQDALEARKRFEARPENKS
jgi:hypothetical protein